MAVSGSNCSSLRTSTRKYLGPPLTICDLGWSELLTFTGRRSNYIDQECVFDMGLVTSPRLCLTSSSYGTNYTWFLGDCEYVRLEVRDQPHSARDFSFHSTMPT